MPPIWSAADGPHVLFLEMVEICVVYALSLGFLVVIARLGVQFTRKHYPLANESHYSRAWALSSAALAAGQFYVIYSFYDDKTPFITVLFYSVCATLGLAIGLVFTASVLAIAVFLCRKYL